MSSQEIFLHKTTALIKLSEKNSIRPNLATITKELQTQKLFQLGPMKKYFEFSAH